MDLHKHGHGGQTAVVPASHFSAVLVWKEGEGGGREWLVIRVWEDTLESVRNEAPDLEILAPECESLENRILSLQTALVPHKVKFPGGSGKEADQVMLEFIKSNMAAKGRSEDAKKVTLESVTALREFREETGLTLLGVRLEPIHTAVKRADNHTQFFFLAGPGDYEGDIRSVPMIDPPNGHRRPGIIEIIDRPVFVSERILLSKDPQWGITPSHLMALRNATRLLDQEQETPVESAVGTEVQDEL